MFELERTVAGLFRLMRSRGYAVADLEYVRHAYDFGVSLFSGRFEVDGGPIQVHWLGSASVFAHLRAPAYMVGVETLHNAYQSGDWGDGRPEGALDHRRERVRRVLGDEAEQFLFDIHQRKRQHESLATLIEDVDTLAERERWIILHRLADLLDKWDDGRVFYSADGRTDRDFVAGREADLVELARRLGGAELADSFQAAFERASGEQVPDSLKLDRVYSVVVPPLSHSRRWAVAGRGAARASLAPVRRRLRRRAKQGV